MSWYVVVSHGLPNTTPARTAGGAWSRWNREAVRLGFTEDGLETARSKFSPRLCECDSRETARACHFDRP